MQRKSIQSKNLLLAFRRMSDGAWMDIIKLYENHQIEVERLDLDAELEIKHLYLEALHEIKDYQVLILASSLFVPLTLDSELNPELGRHYFEDALYWKSNAQIKLMDYENAAHTLRQLVKMNPREKVYQQRLLRCLFIMKPDYVRTMRAVSVFLFFAAAIVVLLEIFIINTFYFQYLEIVQYLRSGLFVSALLFLSLGDVWHWLGCRREM